MFHATLYYEQGRHFRWAIPVASLAVMMIPGLLVVGINRLWPGLGRPTPAQFTGRIQQVGKILRAGPGDPYAGKKLFASTCAGCHVLFAAGGHVGPDLTAYQRSDVEALVRNVVDPGAEVREGYEAFEVETKDERSLTGFIVERDERVVVLRGLDGQNVSLQRADIAELKAASASLMPEGLLDQMTGQQVRDLFAYLRSTQPLTK